MSARVRKTAKAEIDLDEIWLFVALDDVNAADRLPAVGEQGAFDGD